jgi:hypothetical protein
MERVLRLLRRVIGGDSGQWYATELRRRRKTAPNEGGAGYEDPPQILIGRKRATGRWAARGGGKRAPLNGASPRPADDRRQRHPT